MEEHAGYAGRLLADRYRLPRPPSEEYELAESLAWDTASGQEVLVRQVPLPEVVEAEVVEDDHGQPPGSGPGGGRPRGSLGRATRRPADPVVRRAVEAALAASRVPDHPRLDQVFDVFVEGDGLWIVSELVPARPLAALLAERPLGAHRAAEIGADLLAALRVVHTHGWTHRNVSARTVLVCEDGRALLTGLAVGAAEEALCGYDPLPAPGPAPMPPSGGVPPGLSPGRGGGEPGAGAGGGRAVLATVREVPGGTPVRGAESGLEQAPEGRDFHGRASRGPATFTGQPLPEGFDPRHPEGFAPRDVAPREEEPSGGPGETGRPGEPGGPGGVGGPGGRSRGAHARRPPVGGDARSRGIFGFEGVEQEQEQDGRGGVGFGPGQPGPEPGSGPRPGPGPRGLASPGRGDSQSPVAHGYGTTGAPGAVGDSRNSGDSRHSGDSGDSGDELSARAARRGAIAAYRAGTQRAAAESREGDRRSPGDGASRPGADWWATAPGGDRGPGGRGEEVDAGRVLDDDVRWLPSDEDEVLPDAVDGGVRGIGRDEVYGPGATGPYGQRPPSAATGPTALPGARTDSRSVPASWSTGPAGRVPDEDAREAENAGLHIFDAPGQAPHERVHPWDEPDEPYARGGFADGDGGERWADADDDPDADNGQAYGEPYGEGHAERDLPWGGTYADDGRDGRYRGPATALAAERARHTRMTVVGPVTERWAPEQAGPVYENWRLAPPVGPAADLWALGALLFRSVQGHAPYPEDSAAELVQMVCAEPPAFAEDCGPLRPVVESLMRQDPTERPDFEELRGWLRSLIRSAPEPEVGLRTVTAPPSLEPGGPADPRRLPIVRRRGELVRRRRRERRPAVAERPPRESRSERAPKRQRSEEPDSERSGSPRRLGKLIVGLVLLGMAAAVMYAMLFMPKQGEGQGAQKGSVVVPDEGSSAGDGAPDDKDSGDGRATKDPKAGGGDGKSDGGKSSPGSGARESKSAKAPDGYKTSRDPAGFQVAVPEAWDRRSANGRGQVRYNGGEIEMVVVKGRDSTDEFGKDPMTYQSEDEPELAPYRSSDWAGTGGLRRIDVGETAMAEGTFKWKDGGRQVYARNRAMILDGRYHVLLVIGSEARKAEIDKHFESVADTYRVTR